jgi:hypothetical protein
MEILIGIIILLVAPQILTGIMILLNLAIRRIPLAEAIEDAKGFRIFLYLVVITGIILTALSNLLT